MAVKEDIGFPARLVIGRKRDIQRVDFINQRDPGLWSTPFIRADKVTVANLKQVLD